MTDATPLPDDEIVSAVLDGEATADERVRVEADPDLVDRRARFADNSRRVAAPVRVAPRAREQAISAALAEYDRALFDDPADPVAARPAPSPSPADPPVRADDLARDELAQRRAGRDRSSRSLPILAAAAAIVVVLVGVGTVLRSASQSTDTVASVALDQEADEAGPSEVNSDGAFAGDAPRPTTTVAGGPPPAPSTTTVPSPGPTPPTDNAAVDRATRLDLGAVSGPGELRTALSGAIDQQVADGSGTAPTTPPGAPIPSFSSAEQSFIDCGSFLRAVDPEITDVLVVATVVYQGRPGIALAFTVDQVAYPAANGSVRIYAVDPDDCSTRSVQTLR